MNAGSCCAEGITRRPDPEGVPDIDMSEVIGDGDCPRRCPPMQALADVGGNLPVLLGPGCDGFREKRFWVTQRGGVYVLRVDTADVEVYDRSGDRRTVIRLDRRGIPSLPMFGLFVCGCDAFSEDGFAYSDCGGGLKRLYLLLRQHRRITGGTKRVIVADEGREDPRHDRAACFMRAHGRLWGFRAVWFGWKPVRSPRPAPDGGMRKRPRRSARRVGRRSGKQESG